MSGALRCLRVVELACGVSGSFCGKLLADLGATVLKIERPGGDPVRGYGPFPGGGVDPAKSGLFLYLNENKLAATLDATEGDGRSELDRLCRAADVLVESVGFEAPRLESLRRSHPGLVIVSLTPFRSSGAMRGWRAGELGIVHASGLGWETPFNQVEDPERQPPLKPFGHQVLLLAGWVSAVAALVALRRRDRTGEGDHVEVTELEAAWHALRPNFAFASHESKEGTNRARLVQRRTWGLPWIYRAADGWVSIAVIADSHWKAIREMMGDPDWARSPLFDSARGRYQNSDAVRPALADWIAGEKRERLYEDGQARHVPVFPLQDVSDLVASPHLRSRAFFRKVTEDGVGEVLYPGYALRWSTSAGPARRRGAPRPGADDRIEFLSACAQSPSARREHAAPAAGALPLSGVRILDFGWVVAVPFATSWLGALGADVVRVESASRPDPARFLAVVPGAPAGPNASPYYNHLNLSKRSIAIDLSRPGARDLVRRLVPRFDVVVENFTVGHLEGWGLGYDQLRALRADVILLSASPLGQTGPESRCVGWGPNTQAWAGLSALTGYAGGAPCGIGGTWPDFTAAIAIAFAILAALHHRDRTGEGQRIDLALSEVILSMLPEAFLEWSMNGRAPERAGNGDPCHAPHDVYRCRGDDAWVAISVEEDAEWPPLARAIGRPGWAAELATASGRRRHRDEIDGAIAAWTATRDPFEVERELQAAGARASAIRNTEQVLLDPALRELCVSAAHPVTGSNPILGFPARFHGFRHRITPAPLLGADTEAVLLELGIEDWEVRQLHEAGVLR